MCLRGVLELCLKLEPMELWLKGMSESIKKWTNMLLVLVFWWDFFGSKKKYRMTPALSSAQQYNSLTLTKDKI